MVARLGFDAVAFDISETAVRLARQRFPDSAVRYVAADLLDLPERWVHAFDLVVEIITVQALPRPSKVEAIVDVGRLVGSGGTLIAIVAVHDEADGPVKGPPWPLDRVLRHRRSDTGKHRGCRRPEVSRQPPVTCGIQALA
ncbi:MAG TPA: class I SAM-dependent methyltransferase [Burkholderiaceae bacterium]